MNYIWPSPLTKVQFPTGLCVWTYVDSGPRDNDASSLVVAEPSNTFQAVVVCIGLSWVADSNLVVWFEFPYRSFSNTKEKSSKSQKNSKLPESKTDYNAIAVCIFSDDRASPSTVFL